MAQNPTAVRPAERVPAIIAVLLLFDSLHYVFARLLLPHLPPGTSAMYVLLVATVEVGVYLVLSKKLRPGVFLPSARFFLTIGFLVAAATVLSYTAVAYIDPGTASLLAQTVTIFSLGFGLVWLGDRLSGSELTGAIVALAGVFTISFQPGDYLRLGSLIVLSGNFMYALHAAVVKRYGGEIDFANFFFFRVASTTGFLLVFSVARQQLVWPDFGTWMLLLLVGTVDVVLSRVLYYLALRRLRLSFHAIFLTLSPVITILWSMLLFETRPSTQGILGGVGVMAGVAIVSLRRSAR